MYIQEKPYIPFAAAMIFAARAAAGGAGRALRIGGILARLDRMVRLRRVRISEYPAVGGAGENRPSENDAPPLALCAVFGGHRRVRVGVCRLHYRKRGRQRGLGRNAWYRRFLLHPERVRTGDVFPAQTAHSRARADGRVLQTEKITQRSSENLVLGFQTTFAFTEDF